MTRELAAGLLWSESPEAQARSSLRQTLLIIRRELEAAGFDGLGSDRLSIFIDKSRIETDIDALFAELKRGEELPRRLLAEKRLQDRLFDRMEGLDESFTVWLRNRRQQIYDGLRTILEDRLSPAKANWGVVEQAAVALLNLDPTHEPACRAFIHARARAGDFAGAVRAYDDLWRVLEEEFDTQPARETQDLIVSIKLGAYSPEPEESEKPEGGFKEPEKAGRGISPSSASGNIVGDFRPAIIVEQGLHFDETSRDARLAEVFRHDLISRLVRFREWSVVDAETEVLARSPIPVYRVSISTASTSRAATFSVVIKNSRTRAYIWGRDYEVRLEDLFSMQPHLISHIAMAMRVNISAARLTQLMKVPATSLQVYDLLLQGQQLHYSWLYEETQRAEAVFEQIIELDPAFGPAYSSLAQVLNSRHIIFPGRRRLMSDLRRADELAGMAITLDPFDSRAFLCAGWTAALREDFETAEVHHRRALELNRNDPWTALSAAHGLGYYGYREEAKAVAVELNERGMLISPLHWSYYVGIMFLSGDYQAAADTFVQMDSGYVGVEAWYVAALAKLGRAEEASAACKRMEQRIAGRWVADASPTSRDIFEWLSECFPIADLRQRDELWDGLRSAGMDVPD
ncbi:hypothetical protein H2509_18435 [Stappia sp. F7233]|uniref:Bacterial transcriptional activator domain-containing protein n=1 Tax=Stappia albiluteola TaxID=2758565 RepID=A0A839AJN1_9HYPH|nr:BTAD domain-containing putative transcriptional regulator [Stappia albiluteola]MBA5779112.1 hypothetical protein [Stappia albiluteola]